MRSPGQYTYETYLKIFGTIFAPSWRELTEESRSNWARFELATRIDCTCNSDPLGRCVVHSAIQNPPAAYDVSQTAIRTKEQIFWHPKGCTCGNCAGGTMPVHVLTVTLPSANAPRPPTSSAPEKSVDEKALPTISEMSGLVEDFTEGRPLKEYLDDLRGKADG